MPSKDYRQQALAWLEKDPDEHTKIQLQRLLDQNDEEALHQAFSQRLAFGTAGLRGLMGVGPNNMNRLVVRETTAGLAEYLHKARLEKGKQRVIIAYDGRHGSYEFAQDAAGVLAARDIDVLLFDSVASTPLCAFAVRRLGTAAGIVVTASHNPPAYNGYKVYRKGGTQINDPVDGQIASEISTIASESSAPDCMPLELAKTLERLEYIGEAVFKDYIETISRAVPAFISDTLIEDETSARNYFTIAYTPLHGVGAKIAERLLKHRGFTNVYTVKEQREPDGDFPTVEFPNPEEVGATDLLIALANQHEAPIAIANDPDADRLCICARDRKGKMRQMTGDQLGSLLGDALITRYKQQTGVDSTIAVRSTIVSSRILAKLAKQRGVEHKETLTGFKWIGPSAQRAVEAGGRFAFGYEEALGYMVTDEVLDKDGLSAMLAITELAFADYKKGKTLWDRLESIHREVGLSITLQRTIKLQPGTSGDTIMKRLRGEQRKQVGRYAIALTDDLLRNPPKGQAGVEDIPKNDVLRYYIGTDKSDKMTKEEIMLTLPRIIVRPSGTEPKVKIYCEMLGNIGETESYDEANRRITDELTDIVNAFHSWMSGTKESNHPASRHTPASSTSWIARNVLVNFPLKTFPPVEAVAPKLQGRIEKPILYIALAHPSANSKSRWASRDPRCLYWQVHMLFRGIDFDCVHVGGYDDENSAMSRVPFLQNTNGTIVATKDLALWLNYVAPVDQVLKAADKGIESILMGPLMAGVLMEMLRLPLPAHPISRPLLCRLLQDSINYQEQRRLAGHVTILTDTRPTNRLPGWTTSFFGLLGGGASVTNVGSGQDDEEGELESSVDQALLNHSKIIRDATESIEIISVLLKESPTEWISGATAPGHLDALLFALLHTCLSLSVDVCAEMRASIEKTSHLQTWTRSVWQTYVKPRGG